MTYQTCKTWRAALVAAVGAAAAAGVVIGNVYVLLAAIAAGMVLLIVLRRRLTGVVEDERTYAVAYRAARLTVAVFGVGMALVGAVLLAVARQDFTSTTARIGFTLEFATCALLIVNQFAYYYYNRKMSGCS